MVAASPEEHPGDAGETDATIVARLARPDEAERTRGVRAFLVAHGPALAAMLRRRFGFGEDDVDAVLVATACRVWERASAFRPERGTLRSLARRIAADEAVNLLRERRPARDREVKVVSLAADLAAPTPPAPEDADPSEALERLRDALHAIIGALPPMQRRIAEADLAHPEGCVPAREIATEIRTSPGAVYVHRCRYRETVSREMRQRGLMPAGRDEERR